LYLFLVFFLKNDFQRRYYRRFSAKVKGGKMPLTLPAGLQEFYGFDAASKTIFIILFFADFQQCSNDSGEQIFVRADELIKSGQTLPKMCDRIKPVQTEVPRHS
jgi:hypothetical protein